MRSIITGAWTALFLLLPLAGAQAQSDASGTKYDSVRGAYVQGGLAVAKTNYGGGKADVGFAFAGGYRYNAWLAADGEFYWAGADQGVAKSRIWAITINGKFYPIGFASPKTLDWLQPYAVVGMGGGARYIQNGPSLGTYVFRLGAGVDWLVTDRFSLYTDANLHATPGLKIFGNGGATGMYQLGAKFSF